MFVQKGNNYEKMDEFFDLIVNEYDDHMKDVIDSYDTFYELLSKPIEKTQNKINILDLGCGTGLELEGIFKQAPLAEITGIDVSQKMLDRLLEKYRHYRQKIQLIKGSYIDTPIKENYYDYVISAMTMHHLTYVEKLDLYKKVWSSLKDGGFYIEGDYFETSENEKKMLKEYLLLLKEDMNISKAHLDIPFCIETQGRIIIEAGFSSFDVIWSEGETAIFIARR